MNACSFIKVIGSVSCWRSETPMREDPRASTLSNGRNSHRRAVFARSGSTIKEA